MKNQTRLGNIFFKVILGFIFVSPLLWSCTGMDELRDKIDVIEDRLDSLETSLNGQILAFNEFCTGQATISECKTNKDGSHTITLSDGTKFTVQPGYSALLTYIEEDGVKYWAMYNSDGKAIALKDGNGHKIPVEAELPKVVKEDGEYVLVIGDNEYVTGISADEIVTIFTSYELLKDDSGNVYAVTFTFGDDLKFTIPVDGYKGFSFHLVGDINGTVIKDFYVSFGKTSRVKIDIDDVHDYVMQIPDGWRVKEINDEYAGEAFLEITAPLETSVIAGAAVASGDLKVVAVVEGGKSMVAKLELSTEPFKRMSNTVSNAVIEKYNGVDKVVYGLCEYESFDADAVLVNAETLLQANDKGVSDVNVDIDLVELFGEELDVEKRYVLWAVAAFYGGEGDNVGFTLDETVYSHEFGAISAEVTLGKVSFNDAMVSVSLAGFTSFYGGTVLKKENLVEDILYQVNNDILDPYVEPMSYEGSAFLFPDSEANIGIEKVSEVVYVTWVIPVTEGKDIFTEEDIVFKEFTLPSVTSGGNVSVSASEATVDRVSIDVPLSAEGGTRIYYVFVNNTEHNRLQTEEAKAEYILKNATFVEGSSVNAVIDRLKPNSKMFILALATDADGKYGDILDLSYTTEKMAYNSISVSIDVVDVGQSNAKLSVTATGGTVQEYVFWAGRSTEEFWTDLDGLKANAEEYIALYPDDSDVKRAMANYSLSEGVLTMTGLKGSSDYVVLVLAKDENGLYSHAGYKKFSTLAVDLGTIVRAGSTEWESAKSQVVINWVAEKYAKGAEGSVYAFNIKVPTNLTAYVLCITEEYFKENPDTQTIEEQIIDIEAMCSRKYDAGKVVTNPDGSFVQEPDWVDDNGEIHTSSLLNVYDFYVHGYPTNGFATYFASSGHGAGNCTSWNEGECSNYAYALNHITKRHSIDYYKEYVKNNRGSYCQKQEVIDKCAEDLFNAYYPYYKDAEPLIYVNDGTGLYMEQHYASGVDDEGKVIDDVYVVFKDAEGNYYEPMFFPVENHWN